MKYSIFIVFVISLLTACSPESKAKFSALGSSVLNAAGVNVSGTQISNFIDVGEKLNAASRGLSEEQEYYLGRAVAANILGQYSLSTNDAQLRYINKVGKILSAYSTRPELFGGYRFAILNTPEVNAVSTPGGFIFVSSGFLKQLSDEDGLAAVLAHEIAHVALGHGTAAISQANITSAMSILGREAANYSDSALTQQLVGTFGDSVEEVTQTLLTKGYSRSQEYEADLYAVELLKKVGYQQGAILAVLRGLEEAKVSKGGWFSTHPEPADRVEELNDELTLAAMVSDKNYLTRRSRFARALP